MMNKRPRFWISIIAFQVIFGLAVFAMTRQYYIEDSNKENADLSAIRQPSSKDQGRVTDTNSRSLIDSATFNRFIDKDPAELLRQANESFGNKQYTRAADLYERLLVLDPDNVNTYNNLGITLHYLGRSAEALRILNKGVAADHTHQRIWLTLGFVNAQVGNIDQARTALTTAADMDADNEIAQSAIEMLENLP